MSELPDNWVRTPLEAFGQWGSGGTPKRTNPGYYDGGKIPWLIIGDLNDGVVTHSATHITEVGLANSSAKLLPAETLLIAMYGSIGKLGITGFECATNQAIAFCKPDDDVTTLRYLFYVLMNAKSGLIAQGQGGAQQNISQGILKAHEVPLAPLNEQKRIADKLDAVLARVDACRDRLDRIPAILKRFRQSVLAAATSGKLTEDWRSPATDDQDDSFGRGHGAMGEGPFEIPSGWEWKSLVDLTINFDGRRVPIKASDRAKRHGQYKYYGAFGVIDTIDGFLFDGEFLLLAEDGKNLESRDRPISLVANGKFWVNNHAHVMQAKPGMVLAYLNFWINSPTCDLSDLLTGIDQVKLTRGAMDRIPVPVPTPEEQTEIVRRVEALFACADRLEARYTAARAQVGKLTPATLTKAFRGELVPQDPNDEPASALLERIRTTNNVNQDAGNRARSTRISPQVTATLPHRKHDKRLI